MKFTMKSAMVASVAAMGLSLAACDSAAENEMEAEAEAMLWADEQQKQWRRDIDSMERRLDELDDEEAREVAAIADRYADVKPHTTAAAVVFALTPEDAKGGLR